MIVILSLLFASPFAHAFGFQAVVDETVGIERATSPTDIDHIAGDAILVLLSADLVVNLSHRVHDEQWRYPLGQRRARFRRRRGDQDAGHGRHQRRRLDQQPAAAGPAFGRGLRTTDRCRRSGSPAGA
ncbi:MAG: hypothetical protein KDG52_01960 [Rhodocyclaceae bacterium]|nr:hypothetical protein [Rhodocyclaceae bacterium]